MFDWFWSFLYSISKTLFRLIDGLMSCANILCGIEPVSVGGESTDFLYYLFSSDQIWFAFRVAALLGTIILVIFTVFAILRAIIKDKPEGTPGQICLKAFKSFLMFLFVPTVMIAVMWMGNEFMKAMYAATTQGSTSLGNFLFISFAQGDPVHGLHETSVNYFLENPSAYTDTDIVWQHMDLSYFEFMFSWLAGAVILVSLASSMLLFVDRVISIVILYIVSPFSISTSVLDDGSHFKLWRDQVMVKFIMGYGAVLALNIYALICGLVSNSQLVFFENSFLNFLMKLLLIGGGALTLKKSMALIGNLVQAGAGSNELRDNELAVGGMRRALGAIGGGLATATGLSAAKGIIGSAIDAKKRDLGEKLLKKMGYGISDNRSRDSQTDKDSDQEGGSDSQNREKPDFNGANGNQVKDAIQGSNPMGQNGNSQNNQNQFSGGQNGNGMVNNAIMNGGSRPKEEDDDDDLR